MNGTQQGPNTTRPSPRGVNLHPPNHTPKTLTQTTFDVIVIGSAPVGRGLAAQTAAGGLSAVVVEEELFGGDCPFWACIPSKALLRPAEALESARMVTGAKELIAKEPVVDARAAFERRDKFVRKWNDQFLVDLSLSQGVQILRGRGKLVGEKTVSVKNENGEEITIIAKHAVVLATGSSPVIPNITGLSEVAYWTPREATSADTVPEHLIIVGAGAVGCEMASVFSDFGSRVSLICSSSEILPNCEPEAGKTVRETLEKHDVTIYLSVKAKEVRTEGSTKISVMLSNGEKISGSTLLIAAGRTPNSNNMGLESLGIGLPIAVNESLAIKSARDWLFAVGDINGLSPMTHMGVYQAKIAANSILARARGQKIEALPWSRFANTANQHAVSQVIFTNPNVAFVGLTAAAARKKGINVRTVKVPFQFPGAWVHAEINYEGWAQWVIDSEKSTLVGATFVGREAADLLYPSTVAVVGQITLDRLFHAVPSFPTMSEIYVALMSAL